MWTPSQWELTQQWQDSSLITLKSEPGRKLVPLVTAIATVVSVDVCTGAGLKVYTHVHFCNAFAAAFIVCIVSTHPRPPFSEQLDKVHLMMCQVCLFPLFYGWVAAFYLSPLTSAEPRTMISHSLSRMQTERRHGVAIGHVREQRSCHFCSGFIDWVGLPMQAQYPPLLEPPCCFHNVDCLPPISKEVA